MIFKEKNNQIKDKKESMKINEEMIDTLESKIKKNNKDIDKNNEVLKIKLELQDELKQEVQIMKNQAGLQTEEITNELEDEETKEMKFPKMKSNKNKKDLEKELKDKMYKSFIKNIQRIASLIFALKDDKASEEIQNIDPKLLKLFNPIADVYNDIDEYCANQLNKQDDTDSNDSSSIEIDDLEFINIVYSNWK